MAKDTKDTEKTAETIQPSNSKPTKFPLERLRQDCLKILGVTTSTFDGATIGLTGKFTVDEIRKKIEEWQSKPIKPKKGAE